MSNDANHTGTERRQFAREMSQQLAGSQLAPADLRFDATAIQHVIEAGAAFGLNYAESLRHLRVTSKGLCASATLLCALVKRSPDYEYLLVQEDVRSRSVVCRCKRKGEPVEVIRVATLEDDERGANLDVEALAKLRDQAVRAAVLECWPHRVAAFADCPANEDPDALTLRQSVDDLLADPQPDGALARLEGELVACRDDDQVQVLARRWASDFASGELDELTYRIGLLMLRNGGAPDLASGDSGAGDHEGDASAAS